MEQGSGYQGALLQDSWAKPLAQKHLKPLLAKARQGRKYAWLKNSDFIALQQATTNLAITSTGQKTGNPRFLKKAQRNLKRKQQALFRCKKGSKGRHYEHRSHFEQLDLRWNSLQ